MASVKRETFYTMARTRVKEEIEDSEDELDLLATSESTTPTLVESAATTPARSESPTPSVEVKVERRTKYASAVSPPPSTRQTSRKRKIEHQPSASAKAHKKQKKEDKKAATKAVNVKRESTDGARRRWLYRHSALFVPLLPHSSQYFKRLSDEIAYSADGAYVPLQQLREQPRLVVGGEMKDYQIQGLSFLVWMFRNGMNCILGDEMGLGKTLQTLSLFAYIQENWKGHMDPHLIICPLSVVETWMKETARWVPSLTTLRFHAQQAERDRLKLAIRDGALEFDVCITTYEGYVAEDTWFKSRRWTYVVLDEGHRIKNSDTILARKLRGIGAMYKLILTGTPVQNNLVELWGLLHWLYPQIFTAASQSLFHSAFDLTSGSYAPPFLSACEKLLSAIMLRRTKAVVDAALPEKEELTVFIPMSEAQRFWTYRLLTRLDTEELREIFEKGKEEAGDRNSREAKAYIKDKLSEGKTGANQWKRLMNLLMQLRQVCDHPYILPDAEPTPYALGEHLVMSSSKLMMVDKILKDVLPKGERVLIFTQWTNMLDLLEDFVALRDIPYARLDGSVPRPRRSLDIRLFQQEVSPYQVFLISTKAGGLGINLTKASTVIMFDSEWNPQNDLQAIARAHRIGQTKPVKVYRLICQGSVEDQMLDRLRRKLFLSLKIMAADSSGNGDGEEGNDPALRTRELLDILRRGSSALSRSGTGTGQGGVGGMGMTLAEFIDAPLEDILAASRRSDSSRAAKMKRELGSTVKKEDSNEDGDEADLLLDAEAEERRLLSGVAQVQSRLFEGRVVQRAKNADNKQISEEWYELQKRARQKRIVLVDGYEVLAEHLGVQNDAVRAPPRTNSRKFDWEDWCIYCRDGGELVLCHGCPRVFHADCHGLTPRALREHRGPLTCPQHACAECGRNTTDCGGMLFRCQTCPRALCEDCLPEGEIDAVGDTLPELNYGAKQTAYYIRCASCHARWDADPGVWEDWVVEMRENEEALRRVEDGE